MELKAFINHTAARTEECLEQLLPMPSGTESSLYEAMRYSIFAGGKRLRPALFMATIQAFADIPDYIDDGDDIYLPFAAGLEMIHTYSLIHDDLPAMDNDDLRRGRLTCHKVFGEATAILAGDALLTHAFAAMMKLKRHIKPERLCEAVEEVAWAAGLRGMVAGQMADMALTGKQATIPQLQYMVQRKTGALFTASILSAAHLAGLKMPHLQALRGFSDQLGLCFQIADDILDIIGDQRKLGKPIGSDAKNGKTTFVSLLGMEEAGLLALEAADQAVLSLAPFDKRADLLRQFPHMILRRDR